LKGLLDSDVLLDFLDGHAPAAREIGRYSHRSISIISWMEIMSGARNPTDEATRRGFLNHFEVIQLNAEIAEAAVQLRREHRLKLPDAIIWATAQAEQCVLVTRNTKDFPAGQPGVRFPYRR
jgi:predicted nucleic acid-binding protein